MDGLTLSKLTRSKREKRFTGEKNAKDLWGTVSDAFVLSFNDMKNNYSYSRAPQKQTKKTLY